MRWRSLLLFLALAIAAQADEFPHLGQFDVSTWTTVDGTVTPMFIAMGTFDANESRAQQRIRAPGTFVNMDCRTDADPGAAKSIVVTGRTGTCGALADTTFTCTLTGGGGAANCNTAALKLNVVNAGDCWDVKLAFSAALTTPVVVTCTMERAV
jgi:hypothetical protein